MQNLPNEFKSHNGNVSLDEVKKSTYVGIYFSAHWCPPCRGFTPQLATAYKTWKAEGKSIEIIFVSSDRSDDQFEDYFKEMPWLAVPRSDSTTKGKLSNEFGVRGIPKLVILKNGAVVDGEARGTVMQKGAKAIDGW